MFYAVHVHNYNFEVRHDMKNDNKMNDTLLGV